MKLQVQRDIGMELIKMRAMRQRNVCGDSSVFFIIMPWAETVVNG